MKIAAILEALGITEQVHHSGAIAFITRGGWPSYYCDGCMCIHPLPLCNTMKAWKDVPQ